MSEPVELYCTQRDEGQWLVWFPHRPSIAETIMNNPYKARFLNLFNFFKQFKNK